MTHGPAEPRSAASALSDATVAATAARLFDERGFNRVTMQALADELGVAKPTLYVHHHSKAAILELICRRVLEQGDRHLDEACALPTPREQLERLLRNWLATAVSERAEYRTFWSAQNELSSQVNEHFRTWSRGAVKRLRDIVAEGQRAGSFRPELDPTIVAFDIIALIMWTPRWYRPGGRLDLDLIAEQHLLLLSGGVLPRD